MMKRVTIAGVIALGLGACSSKPTEDRNMAATHTAPEAVQNEAQADAAIGGIVTVDNGTRAVTARGVPVETPPHPSELRREAREFPTAFLGKWGLNRADCDLSRIDEAKGLMKIEPEKVTFYESSAKVQAMPSRTPYTLVADLDFKGEAQAWQRREQFALQTGGIAVLRTEQGANGAAGRAFRYERC